jgi:hypothetical protein
MESNISAEAAEYLGSEPHNPFNYQDKQFKLMAIDAGSHSGKRGMRHICQVIRRRLAVGTRQSGAGWGSDSAMPVYYNQAEQGKEGYWTNGCDYWHDRHGARQQPAETRAEGDFWEAAVATLIAAVRSWTLQSPLAANWYFTYVSHGALGLKLDTLLSAPELWPRATLFGLGEPFLAMTEPRHCR